MAMTLEPCPFCGVPAAKNKNPGDRWVYFCPKGHTGYLRHSEWQARAKFAPDWAGYRQGVADGKAEVLPHHAQAVDVTDAEIAEWAERHDLSFGGSKTDARDAFEDAESHHLTRTTGTAQEGWRVTVDPIAMAGFDDACQVKLHCGHQHFPVGDAHDTREESEWYAGQLRKALRIPIPPTDGNAP